MTHDPSRLERAFTKSLRQYGGLGADMTGEDDYLLKRVDTSKMFPDEYPPTRLQDDPEKWKIVAPVLRAFMNAYLVQELDRLYDGPADFRSAFDTLESPIEVLFFTSFILVARENFTGVECQWNYPVKDLDWDRHQDLSPGNRRVRVVIFPQHNLGDYRVDFLIRATGTQIRSRPDGGGWDEHRIEKSMIVECDGHDFHEKTKEQAQRDKERDRFLQGLGHSVFRYTGSELFRDSFHCATEAYRYLLGKEIVTDQINPT